jgi:plasmid stabilization system protein ParE
LRAAFVSHYAIDYMTLSDAVLIVRVIHGARDIAALAERGRLL